MNAEIEEIERQIHDLRNYLGPVELLLADMEAQIMKNRTELERKIAALESRFEEAQNRADSRSAQSTDPSWLASDGASPGADI